MVFSMTGFGRCLVENGGVTQQWEIKSVNSRHLDLKWRLPACARSLEPRLEKVVRRHASRGRVDISLQLQFAPDCLPPLNFDMAAAGGGSELIAANYIVHGVVPLFAIIDWLIFLPHGRTTRNAAFAWLLYPLVYAIYIFVRAEVGAPLYGTTRYPYPFIDVDIIGAWVAAVVPVMAAAFYGLGRLFVFVDRKIAAFRLRAFPAYRRVARQSEAGLPAQEDAES